MEDLEPIPGTPGERREYLLDRMPVAGHHAHTLSSQSTYRPIYRRQEEAWESRANLHRYGENMNTHCNWQLGWSRLFATAVRIIPGLLETQVWVAALENTECILHILLHESFCLFQPYRWPFDGKNKNEACLHKMNPSGQKNVMNYFIGYSKTTVNYL